MRYVYGYRDRPVEGIVIEPMSNGELEYILERELKKCKSTLCFPEKDLLWGPQIEIAAVELVFGGLMVNLLLIYFSRWYVHRGYWLSVAINGLLLGYLQGRLFDLLPDLGIH